MLSVFPMPVDADEVTVLVEMVGKLAVERPLYRFADPHRKMNIGRINNDTIRGFLDAHDAVQRMLFLLCLFLMVGEPDDVRLMLLNDGSG
jgi:hypothetical protein